MDHREIAVRVPMMYEVQLPVFRLNHASRCSRDPSTWYSLSKKTVRVEPRAAHATYLSCEEIDRQ